MEKRGQFYLMAAIIIVVVLVGIATVTNFAITRQSAEEIKIYQLSQELALEGEQVINFGIFDEIGPNEALRIFTEEYGVYISDQDSDVYFIYGDKKGISVIGYVATDLGGVGLDFGGEPVWLDISGRATDLRNFNFSDTSRGGDLDELFGCGDSCEDYVDNDGNLVRTDVIVEVGGTKYPLEVKEGENFFFVVQQDAGEGDEE